MHRLIIARTVTPAGLAMMLALACFAYGTGPKEKVAYLGVTVSRADETLREQLKLNRGAGLTVNDVVEKSPADEAGLKRYDILEKLDDQLLFNPEQLTALVRSHRPGDKVSLSIIRQGEPQELEVTLGETEVPKAGEFGGFGGGLLFDFGEHKFPVLKDLEKFKDLRKEFKLPLHWDFRMGQEGPGAFLGVEAKPVDSSLAAQLNLKEDTGVLVGHVVEDSPADKAGIKEHDVIVKLDDESIRGPDDFIKRIQKHKKGDKVKLELLRGGKSREVEATLTEPTKPEWKRLRSILKEYKIVPRVEVIQAPDNESGSMVVLRTITEEALDGQTGEGGPSRKSAEGRVIVQTVTGAGKGEAAQAGPSVHLTHERDALKGSLITLKSNEGVIMLYDHNGRRFVVVRDPQDKTLYEGPIDSDAERAKLPPDVRKRIERLESDLKAKDSGPIGEPEVEEEIRVRVPKRQPDVIHYRAPLLPQPTPSRT